MADKLSSVKCATEFTWPLYVTPSLLKCIWYGSVHFEINERTCLLLTKKERNLHYGVFTCKIKQNKEHKNVYSCTCTCSLKP